MNLSRFHAGADMCQRMLSLCPLKTRLCMDTPSCHPGSTCKCKQGNSWRKAYSSPKEKFVPAKLTGWPNENTLRKTRWSPSVLIGYNVKSRLSRLGQSTFKNLLLMWKFIFTSLFNERTANFLTYTVHVHVFIRTEKKSASGRDLLSN